MTADKLDQYPDSHIIGELKRVNDEGRRVTALAVYEQSQCVKSLPTRQKIRVEIIGDARKIQCTGCKNQERWEIGKAAFLQLIQRYGKVSL